MALRPRKERRPWHRNERNEWQREKRKDEIIDDSYDFTHELPSGVTVSSATFDADGPTISSVTVSSPVVSYTITGVGPATLKAVLSSGEEYHRRLRWVATDEAPSDYTS